jgi:hypothetical protein
MSLEQALADNTAALVKLTEAWLKLAGTATAINNVAQPGDTIAAGGKPVAEVKAAKADKPRPSPSRRSLQTQSLLRNLPHRKPPLHRLPPPTRPRNQSTIPLCRRPSSSWLVRAATPPPLWPAPSV